MKVENPRGQGKITIHLNRVTETQAEGLVDAIADLLAANGYANPPFDTEDEDAEMRSMIIAQASKFPTPGWRMRLLLRRAALLVFPAESP